jgi:ankyrin repeat protein
LLKFGDHSQRWGFTDCPIFAFLSVKEFLTANRLAEPFKDVSRYHIRLGAAHTILAQACLGVLLRLDDHVDRDSIEDFPLARYAAQYWAPHAWFGNASSCMKDGMECLFDADKPHFATWLWIYNEDWGTSMSTARPEKREAVPLYYAAMLGFRDLAEHLIAEHPEHVNAKGGRDVTPMGVAARRGHVDILSLLLEHGADVDDRNTGQTPLYRASQSGRLEAGQFLLDRGADINSLDGVGSTPLHVAANYGRVEFAQMLLIRGARINEPSDGGDTPLHWAVYGGEIQAVRLLLEHGADVNLREKSGETPSQLASGYGHRENVELLSEYGAESVK